jgi:transcriptional regulator with XRE-family HTH domain
MVLGSELRRLRESRGLSREAAGHAIRASGSKIGRLELGRSPFKRRDVADLLTLYGVTDERDRESLLELSARASEPAWWHRFNDVLPPWFSPYLGMEEASAIIRAYEVQGIHDLLQTEAYARSRYRLIDQRTSESHLERRVEIHMMRQKLLTRMSPPKLWVVLGEGALRRSPGDRQLMRAQVRHLIGTSELPNVTLQVVPLGTYAVPGHSFSSLRFHETELPEIVYIEHLAGALYIEKAVDVQFYLDTLNRLSVAALTPDRTRDALLALLKEI